MKWFLTLGAYEESSSVRLNLSCKRYTLKNDSTYILHQTKRDHNYIGILLTTVSGVHQFSKNLWNHLKNTRNTKWHEVSYVPRTHKH